MHMSHDLRIQINCYSTIIFFSSTANILIKFSHWFVYHTLRNVALCLNLYAFRLSNQNGYSPAAVSIKLIYPAANPNLLGLKSLYLFSDLAALTAKSENIEKAFQRQRRLGLLGCLVDMELTCTIALQLTYHCRVKNCYLHGCRVKCPLSSRLPGE